MLQVWFLFKTLEALIGLICLTYHCLGFRAKEPLPHILIFCGTFFGFTIMSLAGAIALPIGSAPPALTEFISNFLAAILYLVASILSMQYAERDFHLMYVSDYEEPRHRFFAYCRTQSICALAAAALHMTHAVLAFEMARLPHADTDTDEDDTDESHDSCVSAVDERRAMRIYFLGKVVETKLREKFKWFDAMCRRRSPQVSVLSFLQRKRRDSVASGGSIKISKSRSKNRKMSNSSSKRDSLDESAQRISNISDTNFKTPQQLSEIITLKAEDERHLKDKRSQDSSRSNVSFSESTHSSLARSSSAFEPSRLKPTLPQRSASTSALPTRRSGSLTTFAGSLTSIEPTGDNGVTTSIVSDTQLEVLTPKPSKESIKQPPPAPKS